MSKTTYDSKVVVVVYPALYSKLSEQLDAAGKFAFNTRCIAQFKVEPAVYEVWYEDFSMGDGWRATVTKNGETVGISRDNNRWGSFQEIV